MLEPLEAFRKRSDCVNAIFISYAASLIVPRVGEVSRCGVLAKYDNVSFAKSLGTVVTERLVDTLTILLITGVTVLLQLPIFVTFLYQQTGTKIPSLPASADFRGSISSCSVLSNWECFFIIYGRRCSFMKK